MHKCELHIKYVVIFNYGLIYTKCMRKFTHSYMSLIALNLPNTLNTDFFNSFCKYLIITLDQYYYGYSRNSLANLHYLNLYFSSFLEEMTLLSTVFLFQSSFSIYYSSLCVSLRSDESFHPIHSEFQSDV